MSHVTVLQGVKINDEAAIMQAVNELKRQGVNIDIKRNAKPRVHGRDQAPVCDYVLTLPDCQYDVGLQKNAETGNFDVVLDTYLNQVGSQLGATCPMPTEYERRAQHQMGRFGQEYTRFATRNEASRQGYTFVGEMRDQHGNYQQEYEVASY